MKNFFVLLLSLTLIVGLFAACGEKKTEEPAPAEQTEEERMEERRREAGADEKDRKDNIEKEKEKEKEKETKEKETKEKEEPKKAASSKGEAIDLGFTKNDVDAVMIMSATATTASDPEMKIVMNDADLTKIFDAIGDITYDPESDIGGNSVNEDDITMIMFVFIKKDGTSELFVYAEDRSSKMVMFGLDDGTPVHKAFGDSPAGIIPDLADDTERAMEEGIDIFNAINSLGVL